MKKILFILAAIIISIACTGQNWHPKGVILGDSTISGSNIIRIDSIVLTSSDTAMYSGAYRIPMGLSVPRGEGGNVSNFLNLTDTPVSYGADSLYILVVNADEDGVAFVEHWLKTDGIGGNTYIGELIATTATGSTDNTIAGYRAGYLLSVGDANTLLGFRAGYSLTNGSSNILVGRNAGFSVTGASNTIVGTNAAYSATDIDNTIIIGKNAGYNNTEDSVLIIDNTNTATPLLHGYFSSDSLVINGMLNVIDSILINGVKLVDWEVTGPEDIQADRIQDNLIDHDVLLNHDWAEHRIWEETGVETINPDRITELTVTQHESAIDHDALTGVVALEHERWDQTGATDIHPNRLAPNVPGIDKIFGTTTDNATPRYMDVDSLFEVVLERLIPGITDIVSFQELNNNTWRTTVENRYYDVTAPLTGVGDTTNIYVAQTGGNDDNDGYSVATPIQSWDYLLANFHLDPGDTVFFNKGDTWRLTSDGDMSWIGAEGNHITFTSYGSGNKPRILGSAISSSWSNEGSDVWSSVSTLAGSFDPGGDDDAIWFHELDDSVKWGKYESGGTGNVDEPYDFYYNAGTDILYVYSTSDPASAFTSVEVPIVEKIIELQCSSDSAEYYTFDDFEFAHFDDIGISNDYPGGINGQTRQVNGVEVRNCLFHHAGDKNGDGYSVELKYSNTIFENNEVHNMGRRGWSMGADVGLNQDTIYNTLIQDSYFHTGWHTTGPDFINGGPAGTTYDSIVIRRNIIEDDSAVYTVVSEGMFFSSRGASTTKIGRLHIYNNLFKYSHGKGIQFEVLTHSTNVIEGTNVYNNDFYDFGNNAGIWAGHIHLDSTLGYYSNFVAKNNITFSSVYSGFNTWVIPKTGVEMDYNLHYSNHGNSMFHYDGVSYTQAQWSAYKTASGFETNSPTPAQPLFLDAPDDLHLLTASPANGTGVDISGYTEDYEGTTVSSPPNIGAYETTYLGSIDTTNWYFANDGDDANHGHSTDKAKETFDHLLTLDVEAGDSVMFKSGDTWRTLTDDADGNLSWIGSDDNHITFTSYGSGDKPRILGSDTITNWEVHSGNIWKGYKASLDTFPISRVFFEELDDSIKWGTQVLTQVSDVDSVTKYMYSQDTVYVYSISDPSTAFTSVEIPQSTSDEAVLDIRSDKDSAEYYTFDGLEVAYGVWHGIASNWPGGTESSSRQLRGLEVRNCEIHHFGSKDGAGYGIYFQMSDVIIEDNEIYDCGRRSISLMVDADFNADTVENILIEDNYLHDGWHTTAFDMSASGAHSVTIDSVVVRRNIVEHDTNLILESSDVDGIWMTLSSNATSKAENIWIYNNLFKYSVGEGIHIALEDDAASNFDDIYIHNNTFYEFDPNVTGGNAFIRIDSILGIYSDVYIRNNITYSSLSGRRTLTTSGRVGISFDYNLYYVTHAGDIFWHKGTDYNQSEWSAYKTATGWETNSPTPADPDFYNAPDNLRVNSGSDAIGAGVDIDNYTTDYENVTVSSPPNIGAYETAIAGEGYLTPTNWVNDSINRYYTTGVAAFSGDPYFDEGGVITYGDDVGTAAAVLTGDVYDYAWVGGTFWTNYDWADTTGGVITPLAGDTIRPVDVHGQLNVSGRFLRNEDNDTIVLRGYGAERQSDSWGYTRFANLSYMQYIREEHSAQVIRATVPVEANRYSPADDFYYADSVNRIADIKTFVHHGISAGLYVIINWHEFHPNQKGSACYFWKEMATEFDGYDNVIFEIFNEPRYTAPDELYTWASDIKPYAEEVIDSIRTIDTDNSILILVGTPDWCDDYSDVWDDQITGDNIMYTLHYYAGTHGSSLRGQVAGYIIDGDMPVWTTEHGAMIHTGYAPFDYDEWNDWQDWQDTMKISSSAWYLMDHAEADNAMLVVTWSPLYQVDPTGFWLPGDTDFRQWGRVAQYEMKGKDLPNHVTIGIPEGTSDVWDDLVAYYDFDADADDAFGSADGTVYGATNTTGFENNGYSFDGTNDSIGYGSAVFSSQTFSISAWININTLADNRTFVGWTSNGGPQLRASDDDYLQAVEQNIANIASTSAMSENVWHHVVLTYNSAGNYVLYVDGSSGASGTDAKTFVFSSMKIGAQNSGEWMDGEIDEVAFFDAVLTPSQVSELYNSGSGKFYDP